MLGMSVKNFDKKPLTITWNIEMENTTTGETNYSTETYTGYYGDATPTPSPSCPWGSSRTSISMSPYPIPGYVTEDAMYTMTCQYETPEYIITWRIIETNSGTGETMESSENFTCYEGDVTPAPSALPSRNPWDGKPWTSTSIDEPPQYVTGPATYDAVFIYDPVVIPTGFYGPYNIRDSQGAFGSDYSLMGNYQNFVNSLNQTQMYYIYNKEGSGVGIIIQAMYLDGDIFLYHLKYDIRNGLIIDNLGYGKLVEIYSGPEFNFRHNGDQNYINQNYGGSLDAYVAYLFNSGILPTS